MAAAAARPLIPDKLYFRIGEVAKLAELEPYVLRFWETEFPSLRPNKSGKGQRLYRRKEVELVFQIKSLLYQQGFTIEGARKKLKSEHEGRKAQVRLPLASGGDPALVRQLHEELAALAALLEE
ncbi:MAG TPA: MerR family transcriptional regulator [Terriglobales bacterium]|nr:MerR family transcriptional regulator [Terriglobales bacterium]